MRRPRAARPTNPHAIRAKSLVRRMGPGSRSDAPGAPAAQRPRAEVARRAVLEARFLVWVFHSLPLRPPVANRTPGIAAAKETVERGRAQDPDHIGPDHPTPALAGRGGAWPTTGHRARDHPPPPVTAAHNRACARLPARIVRELRRHPPPAPRPARDAVPPVAARAPARRRARRAPRARAPRRDAPGPRPATAPLHRTRCAAPPVVPARHRAPRAGPRPRPCAPRRRRPRRPRPRGDDSPRSAPGMAARLPARSDVGRDPGPGPHAGGRFVTRKGEASPS